MKKTEKKEKDKRRQERRARLSLTLLFIFISFCILVISVMIAAVTVYILAKFNVSIVSANGITDIKQALGFMVLISLIVGMGLLIVTSRIPMKPINQLITQMNLLASGNFNARLKFGKVIGTHPVLIETSESFNKMAEELGKTEMLRSDFINNFSHEFKTPIVSISGFAKLLKRDNLSEEERREYAGIIEEESMRLAYMATNVLNLTKIENQTILTDITRFNLSEQIRSAVLLLENKWEKKNIEFDLDYPEVSISGNEELTKQIWINLLDNAIKFSPENGRITVGIEQKDGFITVSVMNAGEIGEEILSHIWNKFYQGDESHSTEGNGIGLAIVKRITELHKGTVSAVSESGNVVFRVKLPENQK